MKNNQKIILVAVIALLVGVGIGICSKTWGYRGGYDRKHINNEMNGIEHQMNAMSESLIGKSGDDFDRAFLAEMIVHHEGAIEMANLALKNSSKAELKKMAEDIVKAQTSEINMMKAWQSSWFVIAPQGTIVDKPIACTMEAKVCPDGSAVGRQGPNCEFAKCPGE